MLAIIAWHIGTKMETSAKETEECADLPPTNLTPPVEEEEQISSSNTGMESKWWSRKTYNQDEYSNVVLEDGK